MSEALRSAVATAPSEWNVEALAERLIALRTEIDTILAGIEAQRTKTLAQAQTEPAEADSLVEPAPVAAIAAPGKQIEIAAASRATIEDQASTEKASDATERETDDAEEISREAETRSNEAHQL